MSWNNLQTGNKKAKRRCSSWINDDWYKDNPDVKAKHLGAHRNTTKRCSVTIHG